MGLLFGRSLYSIFTHFFGDHQSYMVFKHFLDAKDIQTVTYNPNLFPEFQSYISNCLLDISTYMSPLLSYCCRTNHQEQSFKTRVIYYFTVSVGQKSGWTGLVLGWDEFLSGGSGEKWASISYKLLTEFSSLQL